MLGRKRGSYCAGEEEGDFALERCCACCVSELPTTGREERSWFWSEFAIEWGGVCRRQRHGLAGDGCGFGKSAEGAVRRPPLDDGMDISR